ncbi:MAG: hypothetical protein EBS36_07395 [Actinobacteria bacterium]|nr:hypothetical protein [Actinomycetota bacterium]
MAGWTAAAIVGGALLGSAASRSAASQQSDATSRAADVSNQQYYQTREDQRPFREAGVNALGVMQRTAGNAPPAFNFTNLDMYKDPGYAFRLSEGEKALGRTATARGGLISGGALKAAQRFGQDYGSQEYQNAFNRAFTGYGTDVARENQLYNRQAALAGIGQTATNTTNQAGAVNAANVGNYMTSGAAAGAAGTVGAANAINQGVSSYLNYNQGNNLLAALRGGGMGFQTPPGYGTVVPGDYSSVIG